MSVYCMPYFKDSAALVELSFTQSLVLPFSLSVAKWCGSVSVCLSVCLSVHCMPNFSDMIQPLDALSTLICLICRYLVKFGRQEEHPACKNWVVGCCCGYLSGAIVCILFAYGPTDATATSNPIVSCLIEIQTGVTFLVPAYPGCPGKEAVKRV